MVEHRPWQGPDYSLCISGSRLAIVGYSHYLDQQPDSDDATESALKRIVSGENWKDSFFPAIPSYFEVNNRAVFWNRVLFFNFLPYSVGTRQEKFRRGTPQQIERGRERFGQILNERKPDIVCVFTSKGWEEIKPTLENLLEHKTESEGTDPKYFLGYGYLPTDHKTVVCGFRHPLYAKRELMKSAVRLAFSILDT